MIHLCSFAFSPSLCLCLTNLLFSLSNPIYDLSTILHFRLIQHECEILSRFDFFSLPLYLSGLYFSFSLFQVADSRMVLPNIQGPLHGIHRRVDDDEHHLASRFHRGLVLDIPHQLVFHRPNCLWYSGGTILGVLFLRGQEGTENDGRCMQR